MGCVPERLYLFPRDEGCRGLYGEAAIVARTVVVGFFVVVVVVEAKAYLKVTQSNTGYGGAKGLMQLDKKC